jgi:hypothetical protein
VGLRSLKPKEASVPEPQDQPATLSDDDIETRLVGRTAAFAGDDTSDTSDTGDDSGDTSDTSDTGDDSGDTSDTGDDSGDDASR